jgi:Dolichyl-phosphate-mannose-protein mannosyltransferase
MQLPERARPLWSLIVRRQPWSVLGPLLVAQWLALVALALSVHHNGWLYYQGGDETFYWTSAQLLSDWTLPVSPIGYAWSYLLTPVALVAGPNVLHGLPAVVLFNVLALLPVALLCVYGIATRIAGRIFGYWTAALWILVPYAAIPMFDHRYHQKYVEIALPQQLGLTVLGDFPSTVFLLVTVYLVVRALDSADWRDTALAGLMGAFTIGTKPSTALFLVGAILCLLLARRWVQMAAFLAALVPGLIVLAVWKQRGLGELPVFSGAGGGSGGKLAAIGAQAPLGSLLSPVNKYVNLDWHQLHRNLDGLREFFWAVRPLEFVPFAGLLAIGRRSWPKAILIFAWFMTFFLVKGTSENANIEDASFFRLLMPSFPAFLLLLASIPLLMPTFSWTRRLLPEPVPALPRRAPGRRLLAVAVALLVLAPLVLVAAASPQTTPIAVTESEQGVYVPVRSFDLEARQGGGIVRLTWKAPPSGATRPFYTVLRSRPVAPDPTNPGERKAIDGVSCKPRPRGSAVDCTLYMTRLAATRRSTYVDRPPPGRWTYRVTLSGNWVDDPSLGDTLVLSDPVTITVPRS